MVSRHSARVGGHVKSLAFSNQELAPGFSIYGGGMPPGSQASIILTVKCTHPSAYAASLITSSSGALKGIGAPCSIGSASITSLRLGNKLGNILFKADPKVCISRCEVIGGMSD